MDTKTIEAYDRIADTYEKHTETYWTRVPQPPFIDAFIEALKGTHVLDVGSGTGRDGLIFLMRGLDPICLDASTVMVTRSERRGLLSVCADFAHLPFPKKRFDGVWAYTSLLHTPKADVSGPLAEIRRVLKPGGLLGLGLLEGEGEEYRDVQKDGNPRWFSYYQSTDVHTLLAKSGFELTHSSRIVPGTMPHLHFLARKT